MYIGKYYRPLKLASENILARCVISFFPHAPFGADPWLLFLALAEDRDGKLSCDDKAELCIEFFGGLFGIECLVHQTAYFPDVSASFWRQFG